MSIADFSMAPVEAGLIASSETQSSEPRRPPRAATKDPFHRVRSVREQQGLSIRSVSRRTGIEPRRLREQETPTSDLTLSELRVWQKALEVPMIELIEDLDAPMSRPVMERARLLRMMKTVQAIQERSKEAAVCRMAKMLAEQLTEVMPELAEIGAWHSVGQRRTLDDVGRTAERTFSDDFYSCDD